MNRMECTTSAEQIKNGTVTNNPMIRLAAVMERTRLYVDDGEFLLAYIKELERKCTSEGCIEIVEKISGIQNH